MNPINIGPPDSPTVSDLGKTSVPLESTEETQSFKELRIRGEEWEILQALRGPLYLSILREFDETLRGWNKHGYPEHIKTLYDLADYLRGEILSGIPELYD